MKKIYFLVFINILQFQIYSQDYAALHSKYWYYRTRLRNDFLKVGLDHGCSIPMEQRGIGYAPNLDQHGEFNFNYEDSGENAKWGDAMGELGYYIGVLATEYHLLKLNSQETDSVKWELYCALSALNRMDYYAEAYFSHATGQTYQAELNGFMLRDDVPIDFVENNLDHFNYFGNRGFCSKVKLKSIETTSGNSAQQTGEKPDGEKEYAGSYISQDNWINCLVGLSLVRKFVPVGETYKNATFMNGQTASLSQEAFSIALRVLDYFKKDPYWLLKYPAGNYIGGDWGGIGIGLSYAHAEALNKMDQRKWGYYSFPNAVSFNTWCQYNDWRHEGNVFVQLYKNSVAIPLMYASYLASPHISGDLHNVYSMTPGYLVTPITVTFPPGMPFSAQNLIIPGGERAYKDWQLNISATNQDVAVQALNISAVCNCDYTFRGNDTKHDMQLHINEHSWNLWAPELLRVALHGLGDCNTTELNESYFNGAVNLISHAPCSGPYNWYNDGVDYSYSQPTPILPGVGEWSTTSRLDHPKRRFGDNDFRGEFNGIDYMLYHNLVTIVDGMKNGITDNKQMVDLGQRHINITFPTTINGQQWGSSEAPATVKSFEYIVGDGTMDNRADVTFLAGKEITLLPGFNAAVNTTNFTAAIQQFECDEIMSNPINPSVNARTINNGNQTIYPDNMATSYSKEKANPTVDKKEPDNNYKPGLVHVDKIKNNNSSNPSIAKIDVKLAPNPTNDNSKLIISNPKEVTYFEVINSVGEKMKESSNVFYSNDIDLQNVSKGVYNILIHTKRGTIITEKLIVQ